MTPLGPYGTYSGRSSPSRSTMTAYASSHRPCSFRKYSTSWSTAVLRNMARIIGAGPLIVIDTLVFGSQRSKPEKSFFMSSSVQMETPALPTLP